MKLILHRAYFDLLRLRGWVVAAAAYILTLDAVGFILWLRAGAPDPLEEKAIPVWYFAGGLMAMLAVVHLVQGDRIAGSRAFWRTRPIAGVRLLAAKAVAALALLVVVPAVASLPWWLWCGFGPREVARGILEFFGAALLIGLPTAIAASLCDTLSRAVLWAVMMVPLAALLLVEAAVLFVDGGTPPGHDAILIVVLVPLVFAMTLALQYSRRTGVALVVLAAGIPLAISASVLVHAKRTTTPPAGADDASGVQVKVLGAGGTRILSDGEHRILLTVRAEARDSSPGQFLYADAAGFTWTWPQGPTVTRWGRATTALSVDQLRPLGLKLPEDAPTAAWARRGSDASSIYVYAIVPPSIAARMKDQPCACDAEFRVRRVRPRLDHEVPLQSWAWRVSHAVGLRVRRVSRSTENLTVEIVDTRPDAFIGLSSRRIIDWQAGAPMFVLIKAGSRECAPVGLRGIRELTVNGVKLSWRRMEVNRRWIGDQYATASFGWITLEEEARFTQRVHSSDFTVDSLNVRGTQREKAHRGR